MTGFWNKTRALVLTLSILSLAFLLSQPASADGSPTADFSATPTSGPEPLTVAFTDLSSSYDGITSWLWNFGDGQTSTDRNPSHQYTQDGVYTVTLTVTETDSDSDLETKVDYVTVSDTTPAADFSATPTSGPEPLTVAFTDLSSSYDGITSWLWNFGDGQTSTDRNPSHQYTQDGVYTVTLTVTEAGADHDSRTRVDYISVLPAQPTISSVNPIQGIQGQTLNGVIITGTYLTGATSVSFGSGITVSYSVNNATQITATITISGSATPGARNLLVTTPGGMSTLTNGFTVNQSPLTVTSVSPNQGNQGEPINTTITGSNFTGITAVSFGAGISVNSYSVNNSTQITANITIDLAAATGSRDVSVTNAAGTGVLTDGFTIPSATIAGVSPNSADQGQALDVVITGSNLSGTTTVDFGAGITVTSFTVNSPTRITANITISSTATPGARNVSVTTPGGTATLINGFTVDQAPPTITSVSPNQGIQGQTLSSVTLTGTYFTGATSVSFGTGITVNSLNVDSPTQITANITISGTAAEGTRIVSINTPGGTATLPGGFTVTVPVPVPVPPPTITGVSPNSADQGQALGVVITGSNLSSATTVDFGAGITVTNFTVNRSTQITASLAIDGTAAEGTRIVSINTPGGTTTLPGGFTVTVPVPHPTITGVSFASGSPGDKLTIIITGVNLDGVLEVSLGDGIRAESFTVDSPTQITATITIDQTATVGLRDISVTTASDTVTLSDSFSIQAQQTSNASSAWLWLGIALVSLLLVFMFVVTRTKKPVERQTIIDPQDTRWQRRPRPSHAGLFLTKPRK